MVKNISIMSKFIELYSGQRGAYYINMEKIEQVDPEDRTVYMSSGEAYTLLDDDFGKVMEYVRKNSY